MAMLVGVCVVEIGVLHVVAFAISSGNVKILEIETQGTCPFSRAQECKK